MSVRPSEVAEGAQRFSLRRVFKALEASSSEEPPTSTTASTAAPTAAPTAAFAPPAAAPSAPASVKSSLTVDLGLRPPTKAHAPLLALSESTSRLKFSLPNMTPPPSSRAPGGDARVTTGAAASNKWLPAGYVAGGAAGSVEHTMHLKGIVEDLQSKLNKCNEKLSITEQSVARGNAALQSERATSHARITALAGQVKDAQRREESVRAEMAAMPRVSDYDQQRFELQAQGALHLEKKHAEEVARAAALEEAFAGMHAQLASVEAERASLREQLATAKAAADAAVATAESTAASVKKEALVMVAEAEARTDAVVAERAEASERAEAAAVATRASEAELAEVRAAFEAEVAKGVEADVLIKSLDLKLSTLRDEACRRGAEAVPTNEPAPTNEAAAVAAFDQYYWHKRAAERAQGTSDAAHHHEMAMRAFGALVKGDAAAMPPLVLSCCLNKDDASPTECGIAAALALPTERIAGTHRDGDCPCDLAVVAADMAATAAGADGATPSASEVRTNAYVEAVSKDLRRGITHAAREWTSAAGGALPPLPAECELNVAPSGSCAKEAGDEDEDEDEDETDGEAV